MSTARSRRGSFLRWLAVVLALVGPGCSTGGPLPILTECAERDGMTVVWQSRLELVDDRLVIKEDPNDPELGWNLVDSDFRVISAYWATVPNGMLVLDPTARACVAADDEWLMMAWGPGDDGLAPVVAEDQRDNLPDFELWARITAHPWRFTAWGPVGGATRPPDYAGVVRFTDELAITSAACDTRAHITEFLGPAISSWAWPKSQETMVCVPPPGMEPLPDEEGAMWSLPIRGVPAIDDDDLVITNGDLEYRYIPIGLGEYEADFDRDSFFKVDPINELANHETDSWAEVDTP